MVPHFLPTLSVGLGAGFAGPGWADSHFSEPHRCGLEMDRFRLSRYASALAGPGWAGLGRADCSSHLSGQPKCDSLSTIIHILRSAQPSRGRGFPRLFITPLGAVEM